MLGLNNPGLLTINWRATADQNAVKKVKESAGHKSNEDVNKMAGQVPMPERKAGFNEDSIHTGTQANLPRRRSFYPSLHFPARAAGGRFSDRCFTVSNGTR